MHIIIIFCLNSRQNGCKNNFLASQYSEVWEISIYASPKVNIGCYRSVYLGNFQKCLINCWQSILPLSKFCLFPSLGTAIHISVLQFGKFLPFPLNFGSLAVKTNGIFQSFITFLIKSLVDHASYKYCVICMVKHKYFHYFPHILAHWQ